MDFACGAALQAVSERPLRRQAGIEMVMDGVLANLLPGLLDFSGPKELTQYFVQDFKIEQKSIRSKAAVVVSVTLG